MPLPLTTTTTTSKNHHLCLDLFCSASTTINTPVFPSFHLNVIQSCYCILEELTSLIYLNNTSIYAVVKHGAQPEETSKGLNEQDNYNILSVADEVIVVYLFLILGLFSFFCLVIVSKVQVHKTERVITRSLTQFLPGSYKQTRLPEKLCSRGKTQLRLTVCVLFVHVCFSYMSLFALLSSGCTCVFFYVLCTIRGACVRVYVGAAPNAALFINISVGLTVHSGRERAP